MVHLFYKSMWHVCQNTVYTVSKSNVTSRVVRKLAAFLYWIDPDAYFLQTVAFPPCPQRGP
jgi:hypothetical protein